MLCLSVQEYQRLGGIWVAKDLRSVHIEEQVDLIDDLRNCYVNDD